MKIIFAGRDNAFNRGIIQWLAEDHDVIACFFLEPERGSSKGRWKRIKLRAKKYSWFKALDELAFHLADRLWIRSDEKHRVLEDFPETFTKSQQLEIPQFSVANIHSKKWLNYVKENNPDIIFSVCGAVIFKPQLHTLPRLGTLVLHEGLTPEYKGLHTPLWALMNKEFQYLGYTLLQVNDSIDGGKVLSQNIYRLEKNEDFRVWSLVAHKAILANLEHIKTALLKLEENKGFVPLNISGRKHSYYTWMGLSDFTRLYFKNYIRKTYKEQRKSEI